MTSKRRIIPGRGVSRRSGALLAAALCAGSGVLPGQAQSPTGQAAAAEPPRAGLPTFVESLDVNVVNVAVHVTDKAGRPVTGLAAEDFEVFEDGRPVEITNFYAVEDGRRTDLPEPSPSSGLGRPSAAGPSSAVADEARSEDRLHLVVYVDNFNVRPLERNRVLDLVLSFVERTLRRGDRVMLASFGPSFEILHPFTEDPFSIDKEIDGLRNVASQLPQRDNLRREAIKDIDRARRSEAALSSARIYSDMAFNEIGFMFEGLRELVDHLAGLPGRKAVLHVSSGIPMIVGEDLFYAIERKFDDSTAMSYAPRYDLSRRFEDLGRRANANRVSFYMMDAGGLRPQGVGADEPGLSTPGLAADIASDYEANQHSPLLYLATVTGGRAIVNTNNIVPALAAVRDSLRTYYSLGFTPASGKDEGYHRIKVKAPGRDVRLEHRAGYRNKTVDTSMREGTLAALYDFYEENPLALEVSLSEALAREASTFQVSLRLEMPVARMTLLPVGDSREARLRLYVVVMDDQGRVSDMQNFPLGVRLKEEHLQAALAQRYVHTQRLVTRGGRQRVAIGLRDELSGEATFLARSVEVGGGN